MHSTTDPAADAASSTGISRRAAVIGVAWATVVPVLLRPSRAEATGASDGLQMQVTKTGHTLDFFDQNFTRQRSWTVPGNAQLDVANAEYADLEFGFDARLASRTEALIVTRANRMTPVQAAGERSAGHLSITTYRLTADNEGQLNAELKLPVSIDNLYPNDLVSNPLDAYWKTIVRHRDGSTTEKTLNLGVLAAATSFLPAAISVAASWETTVQAPSPSELVYRAPTVIAISNAGPGSAEVTVQVISDTRFTGQPVVQTFSADPEDEDVVDTVHSDDGPDLRRSTAGPLTVAPGPPLLLTVDWPSIEFPTVDSSAVPSTVQGILAPTMVNRTPSASLSSTDQSLLETLLPDIDVARMEQG